MSTSPDQEKRGRRKTKIGVVVSDKMEKTVVVRVTRYDEHPLYGKRIIRAKKYTAHDENNECKMGDLVTIGESRPLSKTKRWRLDTIIERAK